MPRAERRHQALHGADEGLAGFRRDVVSGAGGDGDLDAGGGKLSPAAIVDQTGAFVEGPPGQQRGVAQQGLGRGGQTFEKAGIVAIRAPPSASCRSNPAK